ncbi:hypothetical protein JZO70_13225 [Enterococcus sp. 669A]|uniref:Uncharacterized protein n=1 Tax=Candidatus Enterococcus moelleringii TaxID=2815325 RepID=A0ABS3LBW8_9ENTE|nr:hypothetical protein [Enterococcus sp. 669A]MBO1307132.1 hypothetical protein [Enterococcus sp. 669A]
MINSLRKQLLKGTTLKGTKLSEDWLQLLEISMEYRSYNLEKITALLELPCDLGTLVVRDWETEIADGKPLEVLEGYCLAHRLVQPELKPLSDSSVSFVRSEFTLFQLNDSIWLNPLDIHHLHMQGRRCLIELANGLGLDVGVLEEGIIQLASQAAYELACLHGAGQMDLSPVDYLRLPGVPFGDTLRKQPLLSGWLLPPGDYLSPNQLDCPQELAWRKLLSEYAFSPALVRV